METYRIPILILFAALLMTSSEHATAQRSLTGRVISADDSLGVEGIKVEFMQADRTKKHTLTDKLGYYTINNIKSVSSAENQTPLKIPTGVGSNPSSAPVSGDSMPAASRDTVKVWDDLGREVKILIKNDVVEWMDTIRWSGRNSPNARDGNAVYFMSMVSGNKTVTAEMISFDNSASQGSAHTSAIIRFNYILKPHMINSNK